MSNTLPNLIVLGAMKSGTTSLHDYLNCHPDINMSTPKEIDYFVVEKNFDKGLDWYKKHFNSAFKINGESSQNYSKRHYFKGVAEKIKNTIEECKFIYIVRDPLNRVESHYRENQFDTGVKTNLNSIIENNIEDNLVLTSKYYYQLEAYLQYYPKENFHILSLENLQTDFQTEMSRIFLFLGLKDFQINNIPDIKNQSSEKKAVSSLGRVLRNKKIQSLKNFLLPNALKQKIKNSSIFDKAVTTEISFEKLTEENQKRVVNYLQEDMNNLITEFNVNTNNWKRYNSYL